MNDVIEFIISYWWQILLVVIGGFINIYVVESIADRKIKQQERRNEVNKGLGRNKLGLNDETT